MITAKNKRYYLFVVLLIFILLGIKISPSLAKKSQLLAKISSPTPTPTLIPTPTTTPTPTLTPTPIPTETPTPTIIPTIIPPTNLDELFSKYGNEYNVDKELLKRIANCESNLNPNASTNLYAGLFQFSESLWINTRNLQGQNSDASLRFNAEESIRTASYLISQGRLNLWPNCSK